MTNRVSSGDITPPPERPPADSGLLEPIPDPAAALTSPVRLHPKGNLLEQSVVRRGGDVEAALAASAHVARGTFTTQRVEHAFLEPESTLAVPTNEGDDRTLHVYSGGQGVWDDRNDIAAILDVATDRITVELVSNGGAFGGKEDMSNQAQTALAAWKVGRPVLDPPADTVPEPGIYHRIAAAMGAGLLSFLSFFFLSASPSASSFSASLSFFSTSFRRANSSLLNLKRSKASLEKNMP